eukprot:752090-Hanusia_phi.AAC.2
MLCLSLDVREKKQASETRTCLSEPPAKPSRGRSGRPARAARTRYTSASLDSLSALFESCRGGQCDHKQLQHDMLFHKESSTRTSRLSEQQEQCRSTRLFVKPSAEHSSVC